jgi:AcrR family transcriptional regulator/DNA-binding transcriptional ArsR family regulator
MAEHGQEASHLLDLLSDPVRFRLMAALSECSHRAVTKRQLTNLTGMAASVIGEELTVLCDAGLIESHQRRSTVHYRISPAKLRALAPRERGARVQSSLPREAESSDPQNTRGRGRPRGSIHTKPRIIVAARQLILKVGFDALSLAAVADAAGITRPTISYHFHSKVALYKSVLAQTHNDIQRAAATTDISIHGESAGTPLSEFLTRLLNPDGAWSAAALLPRLVMDCRTHPEVVDNGAAILGSVRAFLTTSTKSTSAAGSAGDDSELSTAVEAKVALVLGLGIYAGFVGTDAQSQKVFDYWLTVLDDALRSSGY